MSELNELVAPDLPAPLPIDSVVGPKLSNDPLSRAIETVDILLADIPDKRDAIQFIENLAIAIYGRQDDLRAELDDEGDEPAVADDEDDLEEWPDDDSDLDDEEDETEDLDDDDEDNDDLSNLPF